VAGLDEVRRAYSTPIDNPLVPPFPITFRNVEILTVVYRTRPEAIRAVLPEPLEPASDYAVVHIYRMNDAEWFGRYHESAVQVECRLPAHLSLTGREERGAYSPYLYLEGDGPVSTGREVYGQPKKAGEPSLEVHGDLFVGRVRRNTIDVITATLPYKQQRAPVDALSRPVAFTTNVNVKIIPHVDGTPAIKQITARDLDNVHVSEVWTGPPTLELRPNAQAPVYRLPVLDVISGFYWITDFTLPAGRVWYDYLKR
jgi:acetoacetate decarboxylase